jgi:O-antigen ligase
MRIVSILLLLFVVLLDRRTAWVALLAGIATLMVHDRRLGRRAIWAVVAIGGVVIGVYSTLLRAATSSEPIAQASNTASAAWRIEGWLLLLSQWASSPMNWFLGEPFGASLLRLIEGSEVTAEPHNFYIEILLRTGVFGLIALLALTIGLLAATWRTSTEDAGVFGSGVLSALLMMQVIWFMAWGPGMEEGILTGIAISLAARRTTDQPQVIVGQARGRTSAHVIGV